MKNIIVLRFLPVSYTHLDVYKRQRGKLVHVEEGMAAVECAGVAFALKTTNNTLSKLPALQTEVTLYTYFLVREGAMELYGFYDQGELRCV